MSDLPEGAEIGEYRGITIRDHWDAANAPPELVAKARAELFEEAKKYIDDQAQREREFIAQYERATGKKLRQRTPITRAELNRHLEHWMFSTCIPMHIHPWMQFPGGKVPAGYVPLERRYKIVAKRTDSESVNSPT